MSDPLDELAGRFVAEAQERSAAITELAATLDSSPEVAEQIREHAHKIKGAAGVFGQPALRAAAAELEQAAAAGDVDGIRVAMAALRDALPG